MFNFKHGHRAAPSGSPERRAYDAWRNLRRRCTGERVPNFKDYGGRGIGFDYKWSSYEAFLGDMGLPPKGYSIERIDNNGPYCKSNCKWATRVVQNRNKRNNKYIEFNGQSKTVGEWAEDLGLSAGTLLYRFRRGWTVERSMVAGKFHRFGKFTPNVSQIV
jgi:hypothetical protein